MKKSILLGFPIFVLSACGGGGGSGAEPANPPDDEQPPTITMSANPTSVAEGESSVLTWSTTNATSCSASDGWSGSRPVNGTFETAGLPATTTFTLSCSGAGGGAIARVTVNVVDGNSPTVSLSATPAGVDPGGAAVLNWSSSNVTDCTASGAWSGAKPLSGSQSTGALTQDATYTISCTGPGGMATASTTVGIRVARLSWTAPTERVDGTPLTDLIGFRVYWGAAPRQYNHTLDVNDATATRRDVPMSPGTWYFAVTARDGAGKESSYSNEASKTLN